MKRNTSLTYQPYATYFLTTTVTGFTHVFHRPELAEILVNNINFYRQKFDIKIHGYVIMPNHVHFLLTMGAKGNVSEFMGQLKSFSAKQIISWCLLRKEKRLLKTFRSSAQQYRSEHKHQVWQQRFDDLVIDNGDTFSIKLDYIHTNPLQEHWNLAEHPAEYPLSSAGYYWKEEQGLIPVTPIEDIDKPLQ